jgi:hypothetical protein
MKRIAGPVCSKDQTACKKSKKSDLFSSPASGFSFGFNKSEEGASKKGEQPAVALVPSSITINDPTVMIEHQDAFTGVRISL